jgi:hypothetical protein
MTMPCNVENNILSTTFVTTNLVQIIELLELHKIQELIFDDLK